MLTWHHARGWESEETDHAETHLARVERALVREQMRQHGDRIFLRQRRILPFELLLIEGLGGRDILETVLNKEIGPCSPETQVYQWVDPTHAPRGRPEGGDFLKYPTSREEFKRRYDAEVEK